MVENIDYGAAIRSGMAIVPDWGAEQLRQRLAAVQEGEAQAQMTRAQAQAAEQARETQSAQDYQSAVLAYQQRPTLEGLSNLMVRFPQMSEGLKRAFDARSDQERTADFRDLGQLHDALRSGRTDLALGLIDRRISADRAAGQEVDPIDQQMRDAIASGNPEQLAYARETARRMTAIIAGPEQFRSVYETDDPKFRNVSPGDLVMEERTGAVAQSPVTETVSGSGGIYQPDLVPGLPVLGTGRPPQPVASQASPTTQPTSQSGGTPPGRPYAGGNQASWRVISVPGQPRDGGARSHAGWDIVPPNADASWRPAQPFRIERPRGHPTRGRQGLTADVVFQDGTRVTAMHLANRPEATPSGTWLPAGSLAVVAGNTGNARTTPTHIHAEARRGGARTDPRPYFGISGSQQAAGPARIRSRQQYERLASGAEYIAPDGSRRRKP